MKEKQSITEKEFETIEQYLTNEMTAEEQEAFVDRISSDPSLQQKVNEVRTLIDGVEASALKNKLDDFHKELPQTHSKVVNKGKLIQKPKRSKMPLYAIAAVLVVVFGILWFFNSADSNEKLFAQHFLPDPGLPTVMGGSHEYAFNEAMVDYKLGNYNTAINKWQKQLTQKPESDTLNYFLGVAQMANGNSKDAVPYLKKTLMDNRSAFKDDANFYLGLALLKQGNTEAAQKLLRKSNIPEAKNLLKNLKQ